MEYFTEKNKKESNKERKCTDAFLRPYHNVRLELESYK